jgi:hypothetical protein
MVQIVNGGAALRSQLSVHARNLHTLTGFLVHVFPEDSDFGETRAKEEIREDFDAFSEAAHRARAAAESGNQEELQAKLGAVDDACKGCHKKYRASEPWRIDSTARKIEGALERDFMHRQQLDHPKLVYMQPSLVPPTAPPAALLQ